MKLNLCFIGIHNFIQVPKETWHAELAASVIIMCLQSTITGTGIRYCPHANMYEKCGGAGHEMKAFSDDHDHDCWYLGGNT